MKHLSRTLLRTTTLALCAAVLAACATAPLLPREVTLINAERMHTLVEVSAPQMSDTATGTRRAVLPVHNRTKARLMVEGRARFGGAAGQPDEAPGAWQNLFIEPQSDGSLQFLSLSGAAREVHIELREGNR